MLPFEEFLEHHKAQLEANGVPQKLWPSLHRKLTAEDFDAGSKFQLQQEIDDDDEIEWSVVVSDEDGVDHEHPESIFLIDHAWTFLYEDARKILTEIPALASRMAALLDLNAEDPNIDDILKNIWKYANTYSLGNVKQDSRAAQPMWYVMDEFGARVQHSDEPNCRIAPFLLLPQQMPFSLMWLTKSLEYADEIVRDYAEGAGSSEERAMRLLPWQPKDYTHDWWLEDPSIDFYQKCRIGETLPDPDVDSPPLPTDRKIKVYTEVPTMQKYLGDDRFELVEDVNDCDVACLASDCSQYREFQERFPKAYIMQFPHEYLLTCKDLLAVLSRRCRPDGAKPNLTPGSDDEADRKALVAAEYCPSWLAITFNLDYELPQFISYFQRREQLGLPNYWIIKPHSMGRCLDTTTTSNLDFIIRSKGKKKIACLYVSDTALAYRPDLDDFVKIDLRFYIAVKSYKPLKAFVARPFYIRFANRPFNLDQIDDRNTHLSIFVYHEGEHQYFMHFEEFIKRWNENNAQFPWPQIQGKVHDMLHDILTAAGSQDPPAGIPKAPASVAIYGVDVMFRKIKDDKGDTVDIKPLVLEFNFMPEMVRLLEAAPQALNHLFHKLFDEKFESDCVYDLKRSSSSS